ncbi:hypothetical protein [Sulfuritalea hydrogenivorans]|uniref:Uncharacterized protein n=1 Tax=Sulfuritalea hydrogenivorans sk43H TaxID=1223802 RepID=W0SBR6_9PROT|nr:hypothetical protein [Sulfuritalea hydrogenivorans]BAO28322.1 hypothetical protein SUTH_00508 [Sulfuritalea hydrogenivorans sk43H]
MNPLPIKEGVCREASARTERWAAQAVRTTSRADPHFTVLAWYKGLMAFSALGDLESARILLERFEKTGSRPGDFHAAGDMTVAEALMPPISRYSWSKAFSAALRVPIGLWRNYRNAWLAYGAHRLGVPHLSEPTLDLLAGILSPQLGAVPHNDLLDVAQRHYDLGTNASVAHAMIGAGRMELASQLGLFLTDIVMSQPADTARIYQARDFRGQPLSVANSTLIQRQYWVEVGAPDQSYWILGFTLKVFAMLFKATGQAEWLAPAERIRIWLGRCHADAVTNITCAKLGWGAAEMFAVTRKNVWRDIAVKSIAHVANSQSPSGIWIRSDYPWWFPQPILVSLDTSVERMFYLQEVPRALRDGGMPLAS